MHLAKLRLSGFRNLDCEVTLCPGFAVLIGENNAGKTNVVDALRILLSAEPGTTEQLSPRESDFAHDADGNRIAETFRIEATFEDMSDIQKGRMVTCLAPTQGRNSARLGLTARLTPSGKVLYEYFGGDHENTDIEQLARQAVQYTYLPPLRNAEADLRPGRGNRLLTLLSSIASGDDERGAIEEIVKEMNAQLASDASVTRAKGEIQSRLDGLVGPRYKQHVDLAFAEPRFERIARNLRALIGETAAAEMAESGLGFNNLLYIAAVLAGLSADPDAAMHLMLVEEPEAHLHPQLQDLLMRYLEERAEQQVQVIATTHSPNLTSSAGVNKLTVLARTSHARGVEAYAIATFGLSNREIRHLGRFLDVTKAALLFARGVLLVEGVAEQLLAPEMAVQLGVSLSDAGVSVINVGGLAFLPFAALFGDGRLPSRCAIVTDGDEPIPTEEEIAGADNVLSTTARKLKESESANLRVFVSRHTLEWDLVNAGNWDLSIAALRRIRPRVAEQLVADYAASPIEQRASALLERIKSVKGLFAQAVVEELREGHVVTVPSYLEDAIRWVAAAEVNATDPTSQQEI